MRLSQADVRNQDGFKLDHSGVIARVGPEGQIEIKITSLKGKAHEVGARADADDPNPATQTWLSEKEFNDFVAQNSGWSWRKYRPTYTAIQRLFGEAADRVSKARPVPTLSEIDSARQTSLGSIHANIESLIDQYFNGELAAEVRTAIALTAGHQSAQVEIRTSAETEIPTMTLGEASFSGALAVLSEAAGYLQDVGDQVLSAQVSNVKSHLYDLSRRYQGENKPVRVTRAIEYLQRAARIIEDAPAPSTGIAVILGAFQLTSD